MMSSYQNISDVNYCSNDWEEFWVNPNQNACDSSHNEILKLQGIEPGSENPSKNANSDENSITIILDNQTIYSSPCQESSTLLSPSWQDSISPTQNPVHTSMSSYFSTFDPSDQIHENAIHQYPVTKASSNFNRHHDRVNFIPLTNGSYPVVTRRKRKRTVFTTEQVEALEEVFAKRPYVTRDERQILVERLKVNDKSVKIWFQNRRLKNKREDQHEFIEGDNNSDIFERINALESKIFERVDEFGYVKLDDKIMSELVNVIDDYFTHKHSFVEPKREIRNTPVYEPISPASSEESDIYDVATKWEHRECNSFNTQDLIDIESIILSKC